MKMMSLEMQQQQSSLLVVTWRRRRPLKSKKVADANEAVEAVLDCLRPSPLLLMRLLKICTQCENF